MPTSSRRARGSGSIRLLPSGRFQARFAHEGRTATRTCDTKQAATAWLKRQSQDAAMGTWQPPRQRESSSAAGGPKFAAYAEQWLASRTLAPKTRSDYRNYLDRHLIPVFGKRRLGQVTVADVREWHDGFKVDSPTARARVYGLLRTIFNSAWRDDLIESTPCRLWGAGSVKRRSRTDLPSPAQIVELADAMPTAKYRAMVLIAATCGLRFGELTELRRGDVVFVDGLPRRLRVRRAVVRVDGEFIVGKPKSEAGIRDVVVPAGVDQVLGDHLAEVPDSAEALIFPGSRSGGHMTPSALYRVYYPARDEVGLPGLRWHDLRHFAGTSATRSGATLAEVQGFLGHSTVAAAMRYQHAASESSQQIADAMAEVIPLRPVDKLSG